MIASWFDRLFPPREIRLAAFNSLWLLPIVRNVAEKVIVITLSILYDCFIMVFAKGSPRVALKLSILYDCFGGGGGGACCPVVLAFQFFMIASQAQTSTTWSRRWYRFQFFMIASSLRFAVFRWFSLYFQFFMIASQQCSGVPQPARGLRFQFFMIASDPVEGASSVGDRHDFQFFMIASLYSKSSSEVP